MELNYENLKKYITIVYELEEEAWFQNELMTRLQQKINSLGKTKHVSPPQKPPAKKFTLPVFLLAPVTILLGALSLFLFVGFVDCIIEDEGLKAIFIYLILFFISLYPFSWALEHWDKTSKYNSQYQKERENYNFKLKQYNEEVRKNKYEQTKEIELKNKLINYCSELQSIHNGTTQCLNKFYNMDVVVPKYRYLIAISSFKDYLDEGRCYELSGHEGAYNLYNLEARLDKIITRLDAVISNLSEIKYNQYSLYQAVKESGKKTDLYYNQWISSTNKFIDSYNNNTNLNNYHLERINKELEYQNKLLNYASKRYHL